MNIVKKIIYGILLLIFIPVVLYNVIVAFKTSSNPNEVPDVFGYKSFIVLSGSMAPNINIDDLVVSKVVDESELKVGDVISFKSGDNIVTHRIVEISGLRGNRKYFTKGDNNNANDKGFIKFSDIEGRLAFNIPKIGTIMSFLKGKVAILILMTLIGSICLYEYNKN